MRRPSFPLFRLGLLAVIGAVAYAAVRFYVEFGQQYAAAAGDAQPVTTAQAESQFLWHDLFGSPASIAMLIGGVLLMCIGAVRFVRRIRFSKPQ